MGPGLEVLVGPKRSKFCWEKQSLGMGGGGVVWHDGVHDHGIWLGCLQQWRHSTHYQSLAGGCG